MNLAKLSALSEQSVMTCIKCCHLPSAFDSAFSPSGSASMANFLSSRLAAALYAAAIVLNSAVGCAAATAAAAAAAADGGRQAKTSYTYPDVWTANVTLTVKCFRERCGCMSGGIMTAWLGLECWIRWWIQGLSSLVIRCFVRLSTRASYRRRFRRRSPRLC